MKVRRRVGRQEETNVEYGEEIRTDSEAKKKDSKEDACDYNQRYMVKPQSYCTLLFLLLSLLLNW